MDNTAAATGTGTYIYAIVPAEAFQGGDQQLTAKGLGESDGRVRILQQGDLAAIVSDVPLMQYDVTEENLTAHQRVLDEVMERSDVLPVSFGIVATNDEEIKQVLLEAQSEALHQSLDYVKGRVELTLQVLWNQDQLFREIAEENQEIQQLRDAIAGQPVEATYNERVRLGELVAASVQQKTEQEANSILQALQPLAVETKLNENMTDTMLLNAAFLVDKDKIAEMDDKVGQVSQSQSDRMIFRYVGPLPAYDFVNVRVSLGQ